jgi:3-oxoacyl-[acyl-carrier-protein] synthase-3
VPLVGNVSIESKLTNANIKSDECLYMNGAEVMSFTLQVVPKLVDELLFKAGLEKKDIDYFIFHQANKFLLDALAKKIKIDLKQMPMYLELCGNTVSSTIPLVLEDMLSSKRLQSNMRLALVGFGVGYSWAGVIVNF